MYAITGITGKVGGALAGELLDAGLPVRAVVRDAGKSERWSALGCEVALASMDDAAALTSAFSGAEAVFILPPSDFDPEPGYPEARRVIEAVSTALAATLPSNVVCLSTVGADATQDNLLTQRTLMEQALAALGLPVTFLRAAWFLDNALWDVESARNEGVIRSFLFPLDRRIAMVAAKDVGVTAAELMRSQGTGVRVARLEGPERVSPDELAEAFSAGLNRPVRAVQVPREDWSMLFRAQGMRYPESRIRMLDGFNEGWIDFPDRDATLKGRTTAHEAIAELLRRAI